MNDATEAARKGVAGVVSALKLEISAGDLEVIATAVVGLIEVIGGAAQKRATQVGIDASNAITTAEQAEKAESERR